jgi:hypothetical protein
MTSSICLVNRILEIIDEHGFTTDDPARVESLRTDLDELIVKQSLCETVNEPLSLDEFESRYFDDAEFPRVKKGFYAPF